MCSLVAWSGYLWKSVSECWTIYSVKCFVFSMQQQWNWVTSSCFGETAKLPDWLEVGYNKVWVTCCICFIDVWVLNRPTPVCVCVSWSHWCRMVSCFVTNTIREICTYRCTLNWTVAEGLLKHSWHLWTIYFLWYLLSIQISLLSAVLSP